MIVPPLYFCACTSQATADRTCGPTGFMCIDPEAPCIDDDFFTVDMLENCFPLSIGNGYCDLDNNNEECGKSLLSESSGNLFRQCIPLRQERVAPTLDKTMYSTGR